VKTPNAIKKHGGDMLVLFKLTVTGMAKRETPALRWANRRSSFRKSRNGARNIPQNRTMVKS